VIRVAQVDEVETIVGLWSSAGLELVWASASEELRVLVEAGTDLVLVDERDGAIVGSVLGTWDGRRGWLQRLVTDPGWRGHGVATGLVSNLEGRLRSKGCRKVNLLVERANEGVVSFYQRVGFSQDDLVFMEKWL